MNNVPAAPWLGYDPELGDLHGFSHDEVRGIVAHAAAARDAELVELRSTIEALRAECTSAEENEAIEYKLRGEAEARAERLAVALRSLKDLMLGQVKWEPCGCGCPQQRTPDGPHSVTWLRAAQQVEMAISKAEGSDDEQNERKRSA